MHTTVGSSVCVCVLASSLLLPPNSHFGMSIISLQAKGREDYVPIANQPTPPRRRKHVISLSLFFRFP